MFNDIHTNIRENVNKFDGSPTSSCNISSIEPYYIYITEKQLIISFCEIAGFFLLNRWTEMTHIKGKSDCNYDLSTFEKQQM